jgi:hypothetical protein
LACFSWLFLSIISVFVSKVLLKKCSLDFTISPFLSLKLDTSTCFISLLFALLFPSSLPSYFLSWDHHPHDRPIGQMPH